MSDIEQKPILCLDYEGTICLKENQVAEGFFTWAVEANKHFNLVIFTLRCATPEGLAELEEWLQVHTLAWRHDQMERGVPYATAKLEITFAHEKPPAFLTIDDRCLTFTGRWSDPKLAPDTLLKFLPWTDPTYQPEEEHRSNVVPPPNQRNTCQRHPWMTMQNKDGTRRCTAAGCEWRG
jgi:hypothetical protein